MSGPTPDPSPRAAAPPRKPRRSAAERAAAARTPTGSAPTGSGAAGGPDLARLLPDTTWSAGCWAAGTVDPGASRGAGDAGVTGPAPVGLLADLMPAVATSLGVSAALRAGHPAPGRGPRLTRARRVLVLLVDGLGEQLLVARSGHAPFLRSLLAERQVLGASYPTTTATSMGSFGTGRLPGAHGLVGYQVLDPDTGRLLNELSWEDGPDPRRWQREASVFEQVAAADVPVTRVGPGHFDGSGLTEAALRGGRHVGAADLDGRVDAGLRALRATPRALVYVYWGEVDKAGHVHGAASWQWGDELEAVDAAARRIAEQMPDDALLVVTADHGMVDVPRDARWDLAHDRELAAGVTVTGGEPRAPMLYTEPGAARDVLATWRARLGGVMDVRLREDAIEAGWFGPVSDHVLPRIGDLVAAATAPAAVHDSRVQRAALADLVGMHGALTPEEVRVPLLTVAGAALDPVVAAAPARGAGGPRG